MSETIIIDGQVSHRDNAGGETQFTGEIPTASTGQKITQARTTTGYQRSGADISENDLVKVNGSEGRIKDMLRAGLVTKNPDGSFSITPKADPSQAPQQQPPQQTDPTMELEAMADPAIDAAITEVKQGAQPGDVMACILSVATEGTFSDAALSRVAAQMNLTPEEARDRAETIRGAFEAQARSVVDQTGFDSEEVFEWARQNHPAMLKDAMLRHATQRSTKGYQDIAAKYLENLDKANPQAIETATGVPTKRLRDGTVLLLTPHGEIEWKTAVRKGWVKVSRR